MIELIKLVDKEFFPNLEESKEPLNEASGLNAGEAELPDPDDQTTLSSLDGRPEDEQWNVLYRKYLNPAGLKFFLITVSAFQRVTPVEGEPANGYVKYVGETQAEEGKEHFFSRKKMLDTVKSEDISIVENPDDATIFKPDDAQKIVDAMKRNKDFNSRQTKYGFKNANTDQLAKVDYATSIMVKYFNTLCGKDYSNEIRSALTTLNTICRQRQKPLAGNPLFEMIKSILDNPDSPVVIDGRAVLLLNNLVADRVFASRDIISPNTFKASLVYNKSFYRFTIKEIKELFEEFGKFAEFKTSESRNPRIQKMDKKQLSRHMIIDTGNGTDADNFEAILRQMGDEWEKIDLETIGYKPEGDLVRNWNIRSLDKIAGLKKILISGATSDEEGDEDETTLILNVVNPSGDFDSYTLKNVTVDEADISGEFVNVTVNKGTKMEMLIKGISGASKNILPTIGERYFKDNKFVELNKDGNLVAKSNFSSTIKVEVSKRKLTKFDITGEVSATPSDEEEETTTETPTEETPTTETTPEGYTSVEPDGRTEGDIQRDATVKVGDRVTGLDGNEIEVTPENIGDGKWDLKAGTKILRKEETTSSGSSFTGTTPSSSEETSTEEKPAEETPKEGSEDADVTFGGKSLNDISKLSKDEFNKIYNSLGDEDKKELKGFARKLLFNTKPLPTEAPKEEPKAEETTTVETPKEEPKAEETTSTEKPAEEETK